jgi:hypothetical protein
MLFEVRMVDDEGCGAEFTISSAYLSKKQRRRLQDSVMEYRSIIRSHEDEWKTDFFLAPRIESFRSRLHQYHDLLADNAVVLSTVAPKWSSAEALGPESKIGNCSGRYFLSLSPDPFSVNIDSDTPKIDTASCTTHFGMPRLTSDSLLGIWGDYFKFFTQVWKHPFQTRRQNGREIDLVIGHDPIFEGPSLDLVSFHHLPAIFRELHDDDDITVPEPPLMQAINETFTRILPKIDVFEPWHPFQLLEYEFLANFVSEQYNDHAIAFASDSFMSAMFQRLHVAAQLLPRDDFKYPSDDFEHHVIYLTDWMPTLSIFFQLVLWISIITVLPLIFVRQILADRSRSNLPWPVSSIASRAILLCQSRLPKVFEQIGRVPEDLRGLHPIRIGQWRCSERNQAQPDTNWRVDSLLNECIRKYKFLPRFCYLSYY